MRKVIVTDIDGTILRNDKRKYNSVVQTLGKVIERKFSEIPGSPDFLEGEALERFNSLFFSDTYIPLDEPMKNASKVLKYLHGNGFIIVYLTGRPHTLKEATVKWLESNGFPVPGVQDVHIVSREEGESLEGFKHNSMRRIMEFGMPVVGIGNTPEDAMAYIKNNMRSIIIKGPLPPETFPKGSVIVDDWEKVAIQVDKYF